MKLIYSHDVPHMGVIRTYRHGWVAPLVTLLAVGGATIWWTVSFPLSDDARAAHWLPTALGVLMCLVMVHVLRKTLRATNWLMRVTEDGVYIKFRSYLNHAHREDTPVVVHIPYTEIESVRPVRQVVTLPERNRGTDTNTVRFLEFDLRHDATRELAQALSAERAIKAKTNGAAKYHDYPLRLVAPNRLRLLWKASPGTKQAVADLERYVTVESEDRRKQLNWISMDDAARDELIIELAEFGERMTARRLAEERYGLDRDDAKAYIDGLMARAEG